jgi:hypothetical protein
MKINVEIPDEFLNATLAAPAPQLGAAADQPLSGGSAPENVAVNSIPLASAGEPISAGPAEQVTVLTHGAQATSGIFDGGAAPAAS